MKFKELIVESDQHVTERPMGFVKQGLNKLGAKVLPGSFGAKAQGRLNTGTVANSLYKDFATFLGQTGQKATDTSLAGFLKQQGINIDVSSLLGNVSEEVALNRSALNNVFLKVAQQMAGGSSTPASSGSDTPTSAASDTAGDSTPPANNNPPAGGGNNQPAPPANNNPPAGGGNNQPAPPAGGGLGGKLKQAWSNVKSKFSRGGSPTPTPAGGPTPTPAGGPTPTPAGGPTPGPGAVAQQANQTQQATQQNLNNYVRKVASDLNAANPQQKIELTKELINYMADRKGTPEHDEAVPTVKQMIKRSGANPQFVNKAIQSLQSGQTLTMERRVYQVISKLLEMTNQSWKTVGIRAVLSESTDKHVVLKVL